MAYTKRTKQDVDYGPGRPPDGDYCEVCRHYRPSAGEAPECECVTGSVSWRAWCRLFARTNAPTIRDNRALRGD